MRMTICKNVFGIQEEVPEYFFHPAATGFVVQTLESFQWVNSAGFVKMQECLGKSNGLIPISHYT